MQHTDNSQKDIILVVEDDREVLEFTCLNIQAMDYDVLCAQTAHECFEILSEARPSLILMDNQLPDINGCDISHTLSLNPSLNDIPIIMVTSDDSEDTIDRAYQSNVVDYILKPVNYALLKQRIHQALSSREKHKELDDTRYMLSSLMHIVGASYWRYHPASNKFTFSEELDQLFEIDDAAELSSLEDFLTYIHEDDRREVMQKIQYLIDYNEPFSIEHRIYDADGFEYTVQHHANTINNQHGKHIIGTIIDITDHVNTQHLVEQVAFYDNLTKLPNKQQYLNMLNNSIQQAKQNDTIIGVILIGIDRFKIVNDSLGNTIGDSLLKSFANRINNIKEIRAARYGGDTFALIADNLTDVSMLDAIADNLLTVLSRSYDISNHELHIKSSIGIAVYPFQSEQDSDLTKCAEIALQHAKKAGGNRYCYYEASMQSYIHSRFNIETDLHKAINKQEFQVYYQPQINIASRKIIGGEALIRWNHPEKSIIEPDAFISIAEESGLILPMGDWILEQVISQVAQWQQQGFDKLRIGVNLSPMQFSDKNLSSKIDNLISQYNINPAVLDLEVTESSAMHDIQETIKTLYELKEIGVKISMDDFGTGYSSLSYIKQLPIHTLKIDRAFIKDIGVNGKNGELAKMIIAMGHTLNLNVIAEGVDRESHMDFLVANQCDEAQGFLISRPLPRHDFEQFVDPLFKPTLNTRGDFSLYQDIRQPKSRK